MKVWLVTEGEYDDYRIRGTFGDLAVARGAVAAGFGDDIEEFEVLEAVPERVAWYQATTEWGHAGPARTEAFMGFPDDVPNDLDVLHQSGGIISPAWWMRSKDREAAMRAVEAARDEAHEKWGKV